MRITVTRRALHLLGAYRGFWVVAGRAFQLIVSATEGVLAEVMEVALRLETRGVMALFAFAAEGAVVHVGVAIRAVLRLDLVLEVGVALIALVLHVRAGQREARPTVVVEFDILETGGRVTADALVAQFILMEIVVATVA